MKSISLTPELYEYMLSTSLRESEVQTRLREATATVAGAGMQIPPEQGQLMALLVELIDARNCIELGVFTGYSALCVAMALPDDGRLIACDITDKNVKLGQPFWAEAGVDDKIELRIGPAAETLQALIDDGAAGTFDMAFVDADKTGYDTYYEQLLILLRPRGLILFDNVLWSGSVIDAGRNDADTNAIRALNQKLHADQRIALSLLPIADGLAFAVKRDRT